MPSDNNHTLLLRSLQAVRGALQPTLCSVMSLLLWVSLLALLVVAGLLIQIFLRAIGWSSEAWVLLCMPHIHLPLIFSKILDWAFSPRGDKGVNM